MFARKLRRNMTPAEKKLRNRLWAKRLGGWHFRRQQIVDGFIVDFYCHQADLVIEVDAPSIGARWRPTGGGKMC